MAEVDHAVQKIGFILIPGFALMSFASATEPLRAANLFAGREIYRVATYSPAGKFASSSSDVQVPTRALPGAGSEGLSLMFVCAGGDKSMWDWPRVQSCLRELDRARIRIGGISGGPYFLAAAGLLKGRRFTIHWEHAPAFVESFPDLVPEHTRFVIDRDRITCGGGVAPLDMMHALIAERMGEQFSRRVSDWYLQTEIRPAQAPQRGSMAERYGVHSPVLLTVLEKMEATIEAPLPRTAMARLAGISDRHLLRLFSVHMNSTFVSQYRRIRLEHASRLLRESPLAVSEIAVATGFSSAAHFSRSFSQHFGLTPSATRKRS